MKKALLFTVILMLTVSSVFACHEMVHVEDDLGNDMQGVVVELASDCGWGPKTDDTDSGGWTVNWAVYGYCTYTASVPNPPQGYVCDTGQDYNTGDQGKIWLTCEPQEIPEFGTMASLAVLGLAGLFIYKKRK